MFEYSSRPPFQYDEMIRQSRALQGEPALARFCAEGLSEETLLEVVQWCRDHFGPAREGVWWYQFSVAVEGVMISFCEERDAFEFRMRWC